MEMAQGLTERALISMVLNGGRQDAAIVSEWSFMFFFSLPQELEDFLDFFSEALSCELEICVVRHPVVESNVSEEPSDFKRVDLQNRSFPDHFSQILPVQGNGG